MYMSEISKSKVSGLKAQKMIILLTLKHVSATSEHPVLLPLNNKCRKNARNAIRNGYSIYKIRY